MTRSTSFSSVGVHADFLRTLLKDANAHAFLQSVSAGFSGNRLRTILHKELCVCLLSFSPLGAVDHSWKTKFCGHDVLPAAPRLEGGRIYLDFHLPCSIVECNPAFRVPYMLQSLVCLPSASSVFALIWIAGPVFETPMTQFETASLVVASAVLPIFRILSLRCPPRFVSKTS